MGSPYDWRSPQNNNLWSGVNGINNPCPAGWRPPTSTEWQAEVTAGITNYNTAYSRLKLPAAGGRNYSDASLTGVGTASAYWSSSFSSTLASNLNVASGGANVNTSYRAVGFSVRCLKD
jgi:hypothetical protein